MRPSDYAVWAGGVAAAPALLLGWGEFFGSGPFTLGRGWEGVLWIGRKHVIVWRKDDGGKGYRRA
jgi:hypothetical protein